MRGVQRTWPHPDAGSPAEALVPVLERDTWTVTALLEHVAGEPIDADIRRQRSGPGQEAGPTTVTRVPIGVSGHTWAASEMAISTHPLLCGKP